MAGEKNPKTVNKALKYVNGSMHNQRALSVKTLSYASQLVTFDLGGEDYDSEAINIRNVAKQNPSEESILQLRDMLFGEALKEFNQNVVQSLRNNQRRFLSPIGSRHVSPATRPRKDKVCFFCKMKRMLPA